MNEHVFQRPGSSAPACEHQGFTRLAYGVAEAAKVTGLGRTTLYALIGRGELASRKVGGRRIISAAALMALVDGETAI